jgi:hypothetical protein
MPFEVEELMSAFDPFRTLGLGVGARALGNVSTGIRAQARHGKGARF